MNSKESGFAKYLVIFVDILGSKNRTDFEEIYNINKIFHEEFEKNQQNDNENRNYFRRIYTFSDCAYIFYGFRDNVPEEEKDEGKLFTVALCNCEPIFLRFIKERILFRGGISYGNAYIDQHKSMFFGNAVNKAYMMESEEAIHPRIVIEDYVAKKILDNINSVKYTIATKNPKYVKFWGQGLMPSMPETGDGIVETDIDGKYIFNYLHFPENNIVMGDSYFNCKIFLEELIHYCEDQIDRNTTYKIIDKYYYLTRYTQEKLDKLLDADNMGI